MQQHIAPVYNIHPPTEGGVRITPSLKDSLDRLLNSHSLFGGRDAELKRLDAFLEQRTSGYLFVTALSGYGKTALLANWVRTFPRDNYKVCYHFISRIYGKAAEEDFSLRNLCQQLAACHDLRGGLPSSPGELRALYPSLLAIPTIGGQKLVVVLDGLDEAHDWIGPDLFPPSLPDGVFIVFSAREVAERDWLANLELQQREVEVLELKTLGHAEISHLLGAAGGCASRWANDHAFVAIMYAKSEGDPFYLHYLVEDILDERIESREQLANQPSKLKEYLDRWWQEVSKAASETAVSDLLGYLLVARGRLSRDDLVSISQADALSGAVFENTVKQLQRYVIGDEYEGYAFCHPRFREYVAKERIKEREQEPYRQRLLDYCARWREHKSEYVLTHYAVHLAEMGRIKDLLDLFSPEWLSTKWKWSGSYSTLIPDLDAAAIAALKQEPPDFANVAALAVARQTAREYMQNIPTSILVAWIRLGEISRVLEFLKALSATQRQGVEALTTVATELLNLKEAGGISTKNVNLAQVAADLLSQAIGMLSWIRISSSRLEALEAITNLLAGGKGLTQAQQASLVEQVEAYIQSLREPTLQACALGLLAGALVTSPYNCEQAYKLVEQARMTIKKIDYSPDFWLATAYLLPVLMKIDPDAVLLSVRSVHKAMISQEGHPSLGGSSLGVLWEKWIPKQASNKDETILLLREIAEECVNRDEPNGTILGKVVAMLCELEQGMMAVSFVRNLWARSSKEGAVAVVEATGPLYQADPRATLEWLDQTTELLTYESTARSLARIGKWDRAIELLENTDSGENLGAFITLAGVTLADNSSEMESTVNKLIALGRDVELDRQIGIFAVAAKELVPHNLELAKRYLKYAVGLCRPNLPEGDTDDLRSLMAIVLHEAAEYKGASAAIEKMKWRSNAIQAYSTLIEITPAGLVEPLSEYGERVLKIFDSVRRDISLSDTLLNILHAARDLSEKLPDIAQRLCNRVLEEAHKLEGKDDIIRCLAAEAEVRFLFDAQTGLAHFDELIGEIDESLNRYDIPYVGVIVDIFDQLGSVAHRMPTEAKLRLERAASFAASFLSIRDQIELKCSYAAALAPIDTRRAITLLQKQLPAITKLNQTSSAAPTFSRVISEVLGRQWSPYDQQMDAVKTIGIALVKVARHAPQEAGKLLNKLLVTIKTIERPRDSAQALVDFFENCSKGPMDLQPQLATVYSAALEQVQNLPENELIDYVLTRAVEAFCQSNNLEEARRAADLLKSHDARDRMNSTINLTVARLELGTLSPLEQAFVDVPAPILPYAVICDIKVNGAAEEILVQQAEELAYDRLHWDRNRLINDWVRSMFVPAAEVGGTNLIASFINAIERWDQCFLDADSLTAE